MDESQRFNTVVGRTIRAEASFSGISVAELSRRSGIEYVTLGRYLRGERAIPVPVLYRLAEAIGTTVGKLITEAMGRMED